jgi:hypothetical protein
MTGVQPYATMGQPCPAYWRAAVLTAYFHDIVSGIRDEGKGEQ